MILSGDHIYKMDYGPMLAQHVETEAALTIGAVRVPQEESRRFGIFSVDGSNRVVAFDEKPEQGAEIPGKPGSCLGSMGIYVFETEELIRRLESDAKDSASAHDFGRNLIPDMIGESRVYTHDFEDPYGSDVPYWRDVGTIEAYFEANLDLCSVQPQFNLYDTNWPTYTLWHNDPPAKTIYDGRPDGSRSEVVDSLLCPGVIVSGAKALRSILSNRVRLEEGAEVEEAILFSGVIVGKGAKIRRAIVDKWVQIPAGTSIGYDAEEDAERFSVKPSGIVVVPSGFRFDQAE
jgi:glucose-1-phosphate adenylyltransferase